MGNYKDKTTNQKPCLECGKPTASPIEVCIGCQKKTPYSNKDTRPSVSMRPSSNRRKKSIDK